MLSVEVRVRTALMPIAVVPPWMLRHRMSSMSGMGCVIDGWHQKLVVILCMWVNLVIAVWTGTS